MSFDPDCTVMLHICKDDAISQCESLLMPFSTIDNMAEEEESQCTGVNKIVDLSSGLNSSNASSVPPFTGWQVSNLDYVSTQDKPVRETINLLGPVEVDNSSLFLSSTSLDITKVVMHSKVNEISPDQPIAINNLDIPSPPLTPFPSLSQHESPGVNYAVTEHGKIPSLPLLPSTPLSSKTQHESLQVPNHDDYIVIGESCDISRQFSTPLSSLTQQEFPQVPKGVDYIAMGEISLPSLTGQDKTLGVAGDPLAQNDLSNSSLH